MKLGHVYIVDTALARPQKDKITICISAGENYFLWINTRPRRDKPGQMPLAATDHQALTHDCFLDCSRLTTFPDHELHAALHRGPISVELAKAIVAFLEAAPPKTLPGKHLRIIVDNLRLYFSPPEPAAT